MMQRFGLKIKEHGRHVDKNRIIFNGLNLLQEFLSLLMLQYITNQSKNNNINCVDRKMIQNDTK